MEGEIDGLCKLLHIIVKIHVSRHQRLHRRSDQRGNRREKYIEHDELKNLATIFLRSFMAIVIDATAQHDHQ